MKYATLYTDKFQSAKVRSFDNYEDLRSYLVGEVVAADAHNMTLGELVKVYNTQNCSLIEISYPVYVNTHGEVIYAS